MPMAARRIQSLHQLGQGMAELAVILPLLLVILFGTLDLGRAFYTYIGLTNAAREAARYAAVNDSSASITQVQQELNSGGSDISGCAAGTLTYSATGGGARGTDYTVNVSCRFTLVTPFMSSILGATTTRSRFTAPRRSYWTDAMRRTFQNMIFAAAQFRSGDGRVRSDRPDLFHRSFSVSSILDARFSNTTSSPAAPAKALVWRSSIATQTPT